MCRAGTANQQRAANKQRQDEQDNRQFE